MLVFLALKIRYYISDILFKNHRTFFFESLQLVLTISFKTYFVFISVFDMSNTIKSVFYDNHEPFLKCKTALLKSNFYLLE